MVGQIIGATSIAVQLLVTGFVMQRFGVRAALLVLPLTVSAASLGYLLVPALVFAAAMSAGDNALNYSINQSGREARYAPTHPDVTYKAKAFIDMFVQRGAKVLSVAVNLAFAGVVGASVRWLSLASLAVVGLWVLIVFRTTVRLRRRQDSAAVFLPDKAS